MTTVTSYVHGIPSWIDLATPDPDAAQRFYGELFGWDYEDNDTDRPGVVYTMASLGGRSASGLMQLSAEMAAAGMPPVWTSYVTVDDLDDALAKVEAAGGAVMQPAMDVMDAGRMAIVTDPAGAALALWQAKEHIGAEVVNEPGAFSWSELMTPEPQQVAPFYGAVFGWTANTMPMPNGDYTVFFTDGGNERGIAGSMAPPMPGMPPAWGVYFNVADAAATVAKARGMGATILMEPTEMEGVGTLATITDPQGATFSIMQSEGVD